jgi:hypothetical protein
LDKRKNGFLLIEQTLSQPKVNEFLDSYAMNSISTKKIYSFGLSHVETFLHGKYQGKHTLMWQTIGELAEIVLSPFLAVAAWFLLSLAGTPNICTVAVVSFTVGLATKDIIERLINYTTSELKANKKEAS